jgi:hypothetical protein
MSPRSERKVLDPFEQPGMDMSHPSWRELLARCTVSETATSTLPESCILLRLVERLISVRNRSVDHVTSRLIILMSSVVWLMIRS